VRCPIHSLVLAYRHITPRKNNWDTSERFFFGSAMSMAAQPVPEMKRGIIELIRKTQIRTEWFGGTDIRYLPKI
jgi:hypothetical protein